MQESGHLQVQAGGPGRAAAVSQPFLLCILLCHMSVSLQLLSLLVALHYLGFTNLFSYLMKALDSFPRKKCTHAHEMQHFA